MSCCGAKGQGGYKYLWKGLGNVIIFYLSLIYVFVEHSRHSPGRRRVTGYRLKRSDVALDNPGDDDTRHTCRGFVSGNSDQLS